MGGDLRAFKCAHDAPPVMALIAEFYDRISDDDSPPVEEFTPPEGPLYILGAVDDEPASLFIAHGSQIHYMARKRFRMLSRGLLELSIQKSGMRFMFCEIPVTSPAVINFARKSGFRSVGAGKPVKIGGQMVPRVRLERVNGFRY